MRLIWLSSTALITIFLGLGTIVAIERGVSSGVLHQDQEAMQPTQENEVDKLRDIVRAERLRQENPKQVISAIKRLGEFKAESAIADLVSILTFKQMFYFETPDAINEVRSITPASRYPATGALIEIGKPAVPALSNVIERHKSGSVETENSIFAIIVIFQEDVREGVEYLRNSSAKSPSHQASQRLVAAAARIEELTGKFGK